MSIAWEVRIAHPMDDAGASAASLSPFAHRPIAAAAEDDLRPPIGYAPASRVTRFTTQRAGDDRPNTVSFAPTSSRLQRRQIVFLATE